MLIRNIDHETLSIYRKIPKISPSEYKPLKFETQKTLLPHVS